MALRYSAPSPVTANTDNTIHIDGPQGRPQARPQGKQQEETTEDTRGEITRGDHRGGENRRRNRRDGKGDHMSGPQGGPQGRLQARPFHVTPDEHPARHATQLKPGCRREEAVGHKFGGPMKTVGLTCGRGNKTLVRHAAAARHVQSHIWSPSQPRNLSSLNIYNCSLQPKISDRIFSCRDRVSDRILVGRIPPASLPLGSAERVVEVVA